MKSRIETYKPSGSPVPATGSEPLHLPPLRSRRLFFEKRDLPRIRDNARHILFAALVESWKAEALGGLEAAWKSFEETKNIVFGMNAVWSRFTEVAVAQLVDPQPERSEALIQSMERVLAQEAWDYILDGDEVTGVMRASMATSQLLFAREVLDDAVSPDLERRLLEAVAEKGVGPCLRTIEAMANPERHTGWRHAEGNEPFHEIDMRYWPLIFGSNNLRGAPTMGLGLGALALLGHHPEAETWLRKAESSARAILRLFTSDGSYFEGLSYSDYTLRTILSFCDAHRRLVGGIDWREAANWGGFLEYVMAMQAGEQEDGRPDIVNFSDANKSIYPCVASWIERETGDPRAQFVAEHLSTPGYFLDLLWFRAERPAALPDPSLRNWRSELDWVVSRSGWRRNDAVLAFRSGFPVNHEHADRNSFLFKVHGERLLTDHFRAAYNRNDPNWSLRWTKAHNAVLVDGRGHQYHEGEFGVYEGMAEARITRYHAQGERIWWASDATHGYRLVNASIARVVRTVAFAKPNLIFLLDEVEMAGTKAAMEVRFFPDDRDGQALIEPVEDGFLLARPEARLHARVAGSGALKVERAVLAPAEPQAEYVFDPSCPTANAEFSAPPFAAVRSAMAAERHVVATALAAMPGRTGAAPEMTVTRVGNCWQCRVAEVTCLFVPGNAGFEVAW